MVKYSQSKIYKIIANGTDNIYIGSTTKLFLSQRMYFHRKNYDYWKNKNHGAKLAVYDLFNDFGVEKCQIILIEEYSCKSKDQLRMREQFWITQNKDNCINVNRAYRSRDNDLKDMRDNSKKKIRCKPCNQIIRKGHIWDHLRSKKHIENDI